ncbi:MAG: hypothetical protein A2885_09415 [Sphingopyxis sp. RIFCSPHIGHO2_01_FULL_65_24]|nr:MAG: hypothetical protein A2885_09415 [Sphingopyxis sp. RIFCSPHIGHO2_01_FULL_65_24]
MPKLEELITFQVVAESGSYATAARLLGRDTSIISRRIISLESRLGARLITRTSRSIQVTNVGARYLERLTSILTELEDANREVSDRSAAD